MSEENLDEILDVEYRDPIPLGSRLIISGKSVSPEMAREIILKIDRAFNTPFSVENQNCYILKFKDYRATSDLVKVAVIFQNKIGFIGGGILSTNYFSNYPDNLWIRPNGEIDFVKKIDRSNYYLEELRVDLKRILNVFPDLEMKIDIFGKQEKEKNRQCLYRLETKSGKLITTISPDDADWSDFSDKRNGRVIWSRSWIKFFQDIVKKIEEENEP